MTSWIVGSRSDEQRFSFVTYCGEPVIVRSATFCIVSDVFQSDFGISGAHIEPEYVRIDLMYI